MQWPRPSGGECRLQQSVFFWTLFIPGAGVYPPSLSFNAGGRCLDHHQCMPPRLLLWLRCRRDVACFSSRRAVRSAHRCARPFHALQRNPRASHDHSARNTQHATRRKRAARRNRATATRTKRATRNAQDELRVTSYEFRAQVRVGARRKSSPWTDSGWLAGWLSLMGPMEAGRPRRAVRFCMHLYMATDSVIKPNVATSGS